MNEVEQINCIRMPSQYQKPILSPAELNALIMFANNDLNIEELAEKMHITPSTLYQHMGAVRKILNVRCNHTAVKKAFMEGMIWFEGE